MVLETSCKQILKTLADKVQASLLSFGVISPKFISAVVFDEVVEPVTFLRIKNSLTTLLFATWTWSIRIVLGITIERKNTELELEQDDCESPSVRLVTVVRLQIHFFRRKVSRSAAVLVVLSVLEFVDTSAAASSTAESAAI